MLSDNEILINCLALDNFNPGFKFKLQHLYGLLEMITDSISN